MKIDPSDYQIRPGKRVDLDKWPTSVAALYANKADYEARLQQHVNRLSAQQELLYASANIALLIIFQGMDAAGKDSAIRHVMSGVNPQGCEVHSFKQPSAEELAHDFLWRSAVRLPERGRIGIFNRSYYEEVLVVRVHPELLTGEAVAEDDVGKHFWKERYGSIADFERHLHRSGTRIIKFFLHLSKEEQRNRFLARIDDPAKNWKFNMADVAERQHWKSYMKAYEDCLEGTSTEAAPWLVVPADDKNNARLIVSATILQRLESLDLAFPSSGRSADLQEMRKKLEAE